MQGPRGRPDEEEEEEEDDSAHWVRRCPEAQVLQTLDSATGPKLSQSSSLQKIVRREVSASRFYQVASLPSIQEKPFQNRVEFPRKDSAGCEDVLDGAPATQPCEDRCHGRPGRQSPTRVASAHSALSPAPDTAPDAAPDTATDKEQDVAGALTAVLTAGLAADLTGDQQPQRKEKRTSLGVVWTPHIAATRAVLWSTPSLPPFSYLTGCDGLGPALPTTKREAHELAMRRPGFVRLAAARLEALVATADRIRQLLQAGRRASPQAAAPPLGPPPPPPPPPPQQDSNSRIIPLHSPADSGDTTPHRLNNADPLPTATAASGSTLASFRFGWRRTDDSASLSSSSTSSPPHFDDDVIRNISYALAASTPPLLPPDLGSTPGRGRTMGNGAWPAHGAGAHDVERMPSVASCCCRICQNSGSVERLLSPCNCKGSLAYVHLSCLERWLNQSGRTYCELCQFQFNAVQTPRYTRLQSLRLWYRHPRNRRQLLADALIWAILTLVTAGLLAVTTVGMRYFVGEGTKLGISAFTTQGTLVFFLGLVGVGYFVTVVVLIRDQVMPWLRWWRGLVDVRLTLDPWARGGPRQPQPHPYHRPGGPVIV